MRKVGCLLILTIAALTGAQAGAQRQTIDASTILTGAREALGGEKRLSAVKTFVATGRTRQIQGDNLVPIEFEISCELPDKYVRRDEIPARESGPTSTGFNADSLILLPQPPAPLPDAARLGRLATARQDVARLMLGMFAASLPSYPLTFAYVGQAEAPQGKADVLDVKGPANFAARLFVNSETHLPIMVSWQGAPAGGGRGPGGAGGAVPPPPAAGARGAVPPPPPENRLYYADYRDADGMKWPFRLRRAVGTDTIEETTFDRFRVNAKIDAKKFEGR
jgi:hypothetical protein